MVHNLRNLRIPNSTRLMLEVCARERKNIKSSQILDLMDILINYSSSIKTKIPLNQGIRVDIDNDTTFLFVKDKKLSCATINTEILEKREIRILEELHNFKDNTSFARLLKYKEEFTNVPILISGDTPHILILLPYVIYRANTIKKSISYA